MRKLVLNKTGKFPMPLINEDEKKPTHFIYYHYLSKAEMAECRSKSQMGVKVKAATDDVEFTSVKKTYNELVAETAFDLMDSFKVQIGEEEVLINSYSQLENTPGLEDILFAFEKHMEKAEAFDQGKSSTESS